MKVLEIEQAGSSPLLHLADRPTPQPGQGELLIRVHAAGVTPTELLWYPTTHDRSGNPRRLAVPGHEFSGVITSVGAGVSGWSIGQEVYGLNDWFAEGATAEFCLTTPSSIAPKPRSLTHAEAGSVPIGALTAWQGLFDRAHLISGERVLVHGGAGAVGFFAVQLAHRAGAHVLSTVSPRNAALVQSLGADDVIDYHAQPFEAAAGTVDVVFDTVGGDTLTRSWSVLAPGGRLVTVAADAEAASDPRRKDAFFIVEPNSGQLTEIASLLDSGALKTFVDATIPFEQAASAYTGNLPSRRGYGKIVIAISEGR